MIKL
jgi:malate dehydrogenase (oxaloacetate-decarboxylating)